jgi:hypothetical protein
VQRVKGKLTHLNLTSTSWLATILDKVTREQTLRMMLEKRRPGHQKREVSQVNMRIFSSFEYAQGAIRSTQGILWVHARKTTQSTTLLHANPLLPRNLSFDLTGCQ